MDWLLSQVLQEEYRILLCHIRQEDVCPGQKGACLKGFQKVDFL